MDQNRLPEMDGATAVEAVDAAVADPLVRHAENDVIRAIGEVSDLSDQEPLYAAAGAIIVVGVAMRDSHTLRAGTRILASHLFATALRGVVKHLVDRTRPDVAAERGRYELGPGERFESDFNSFPSGHSAGAFAFARAAVRSYPAGTPVLAGAAVASSAAQVLRSKHFLSDVVAGAAIGLIAEAAVNRLLEWAEKR